MEANQGLTTESFGKKSLKEIRIVKMLTKESFGSLPNDRGWHKDLTRGGKFSNNFIWLRKISNKNKKCGNCECDYSNGSYCEG